jgi:hypothetical protein
VAYKRRQEASALNLKKLLSSNLSEFGLILDGSSYAFTKLSLSNKGLSNVGEAICEYPHLRYKQINAER